MTMVLMFQSLSNKFNAKIQFLEHFVGWIERVSPEKPTTDGKADHFKSVSSKFTKHLNGVPKNAENGQTD